MIKSKVSVIIPTFNRPDKLVNAIKSVINQSLKEFEVIVVNDGGIDVQNVISSIKDNRLVYINLTTNIGRSGARNIGIQNSKSDYLIYLDDDDIFYPEHLETLYLKLSNSKYKIAYSDSYNVNLKLKTKKISYSQDFDYNLILIRNFIPILCFMHHKDCLKDVIGYDENMKYYEDWDFILRLSRNFKFFHIKKVTSEFYTGRDDYDFNRELSMLKDINYLYDKNIFKDINSEILLRRRFYIENTFSENAIQIYFQSEIKESEKLNDRNLSINLYKKLSLYYPYNSHFIRKYIELINEKKYNNNIDKLNLIWEVRKNTINLLKILILNSFSKKILNSYILDKKNKFLILMFLIKRYMKKLIKNEK